MYLLVDFVQLLSFRSKIEVDVERTMNAPLKNRMGRKEFYAELQRNGNPLFVVLDAEEMVSSLIQVESSVPTDAKVSDNEGDRSGEDEEQGISVDWTFEVKSGGQGVPTLGALFVATIGVAGIDILC